MEFVAPIIEVSGLRKKFCANLNRGLGYALFEICREIFFMRRGATQLREGEFYVLHDISFSILKGQTVALMGVNGSGKSTLLRVLAGIYPVDGGTIECRGKIGALIALGAGFHPNMTGRENIYLNGALLGMSEEQIEKNIGDIIDFAEIGSFIDSPVSNYSSGMTVRLGFSIAVHCDVEVLLVDEVLAVGDLAFTLKCYKKMAEFRKNGGTTILVTHNNQLVRNICDHAIWLEKGKIRLSGEPSFVCGEYEIVTSGQFVKTEKGVKINHDDLAYIVGTRFVKDGVPIEPIYNSWDCVTLQVHTCIKRKLHKPIIGLSIETLDGVVVFCNFSDRDKFEFGDIQGDKYIEINIPALNLRVGRYFCTIMLSDGDNTNVLSWHERVEILTVDKDKNIQGLVDPKLEWNVYDLSK